MLVSLQKYRVEISLSVILIHVTPEDTVTSLIECDGLVASTVSNQSSYLGHLTVILQELFES